MYDRSKYMDKARCKKCDRRLDCDDDPVGLCGPADEKISEMIRCPIHDPDAVEELNDPEYHKHIESLEPNVSDFDPDPQAETHSLNKTKPTKSRGKK